MAAISLSTASAFTSALTNAAGKEAVCVLKLMKVCDAVESVVSKKEDLYVKFANVNKARSKRKVIYAV